MTAKPLYDSDELDALDLPMRLYNAFRRNGIRTVGAARHLTDDEVLRMRNLGRGSLTEFIAHLDRLGVKRDPQPMAWRSASAPALIPPTTRALPPDAPDELRWMVDRLAEADSTAPSFYRGLQRRRYVARAVIEATGNLRILPTVGLEALPGGLLAQLEGLNRTAHARLGDGKPPVSG